VNSNLIRRQVEIPEMRSVHQFIASPQAELPKFVESTPHATSLRSIGGIVNEDKGRKDDVRRTVKMTMSKTVDKLQSSISLCPPG